MKKFLIILCAFFLLGTEIAWAQRQPMFSASLGGGGYYRRGVRRSVYHPTKGNIYASKNGAILTISGPQKTVLPRKKIIIKYQPEQIDISEELMEKLMPMIRRLQDGKINSLEIIGICRDYNTSSYRQLALDKILHSYSPNLEINYRIISGAAVVKSNDNTMEFVEYW